jgi:hypothetical protein
MLHVFQDNSKALLCHDISAADATGMARGAGDETVIEEYVPELNQLSL